jgi:hypothetical protein
LAGRSLPPEPADLANRRKSEIDRALAELTARLDPHQRLMAVESGQRSVEATHAMRAGLGRPWTDFVQLPGSGLKQPSIGACWTVPALLCRGRRGVAGHILPKPGRRVRRWVLICA